MEFWKAIFDARHKRGTYYGRVAFVQAETEEEARAELFTAAIVEFPNQEICEVGLKVSTPAAAEAHAKAKAATSAWQRRVRERQTILCPTCLGTGFRQ